MKQLFNLICIFFSSLLFAQVAIGKTPNQPSAILDFGPDNETIKKGIILPVLDLTQNTNETYSDGTFLFDTNSMMVKVKQDGIWLDLTDEGAITTQYNTNNEDITTPVKLKTSEDIGEGVIIGSETSTAKGVLVLESENKALILPRVADPHLNIPKPVAGTICYDTTSDSLAIFDGKVWSYWK